VLTFALLDEFSEVSHQAVYLTLGELVSEGLAACDRTTAGVLYQITDSGRARMLAASAGETGAV
jgi:DNA-binding PadR family transcriptional regulator